MLTVHFMEVFKKCDDYFIILSLRIKRTPGLKFNEKGSLSTAFTPLLFSHKHREGLVHNSLLDIFDFHKYLYADFGLAGRYARQAEIL